MREIMGSRELSTSTAMQEVVPNKPDNWSVAMRFIEFSFVNSQDCHVILNGKSKLDGEDNKIFLRANQGLNISEKDVNVDSFIIVEDGIEYNWVGKY